MSLPSLYAFLSVLIVSMISLVGIITLPFEKKKSFHRILIYFISFSAGALMGDVFLHLIPELVESNTYTIQTSFIILGGIVMFFVIEKLVHWQHCHAPEGAGHVHPFAITNLVGDGVHNFIDGLIIGGSYLASIPVGITTTIAVILHEIPQEIGDFGVLLHGGFTKKKALFFNFLSALTSILGVALVIGGSKSIHGLTKFLIPLAIGGFVYVAGSDLIPELHKDFETKKAIVQLLAFVAGIAVMASLLLLE